LLTLILNPASGSAGDPKLEPHLIELFHAQGIELRVVQLKPDTAESIIGDAVNSKSEAVVAGGGDGTVSSVARALVGGATPLGILPLGTLNHFAKDLGIPNDLPQAVKTIAAGHIARVDTGRVNDRVFLNNSSIGLYPNIVEAREELRRRGHRKWPALVIATARILRRSREVFVRIEVDGKSGVRRTPFVFIGNNEYLVEGIHLGERKRLDGGKLFAYLAPRIRTRDVPKLFVHSLLGWASKEHAFERLCTAEIWIETADNRLVQVSTDGEVAPMAMPLHYRIMPGALQVIVPPMVPH
jgi:diacylglycerol kinase family enzyme